MKNQWSKPLVLKSYKYKGFIIEYWEQSFSTNYSVVWHHEFVGFKNGERVTSKSNQHRRYTDCINEIKQIIARNKKGFYFCGKEVSWEEIPIDVRKHDYPYYFDDNGNDCFPIVTDKRLK